MTQVKPRPPAPPYQFANPLAQREERVAKVSRLQADTKDESHFQQIDVELAEADYRPPAPIAYVSHSYQANGLQFVLLPAGWVGDAVHPPKSQFLICPKGRLEVTASDGEKRTFGPGDSILMSDVAGKDHRTCVKGDHECIVAVIPVAAA